ncbi:MAG: hypothetical protein ACPIOQ_28390, partial [Promethearchaeia archaeon]
QVDFFACQTEVCGPCNATIVTPRTEEIQRFVHLKVVAPHVGVDAVRSQEAYWIGMYRQPELRERWVWVSYGLLEDMADARPVSRSFFWAAWESCAIARALGNHYDVSCQGRYNDGQRFKYPCVCQFPDVPHPEFELDMHASRDVQAHTIASHTAERVFMYAAYALFGLYVLLFCRAAVVVAAGSATTRPHALGARAREALTIFPLGLTLTVGAGVTRGKVEPKTPLEAWPAELSVETPSAPSRRAVLERMPGLRDLVGTVWLRRNLHLGSSLVRADTVWLRRNRHHESSNFDADDKDDAAGDDGADAPAYGKDDHRSLVWRRVDRGAPAAPCRADDSHVHLHCLGQKFVSDKHAAYDHDAPRSVSVVLHRPSPPLPHGGQAPAALRQRHGWPHERQGHAATDARRVEHPDFHSARVCHCHYPVCRPLA